MSPLLRLERLERAFDELGLAYAESDANFILVEVGEGAADREIGLNAQPGRWKVRLLENLRGELGQIGGGPTTCDIASSHSPPPFQLRCPHHWR